MTTVGKILVVLHLVLSVMFMAFAGAVFTAQKNWRNTALAHEKALKTANTKLKDQQEAFDRERTETKAKADRSDDEIVKLTNEKTALTTRVLKLEGDNQTLQLANDKLNDQNVLATVEAGERAKEADLRTQENATVYLTREDLIKKLQKVEDEKFSAEIERKQLEEKHKQVLGDLVTFRLYYGSKGGLTDPKQMVIQSSPPPPVEGKILDYRKEKKQNQELVEISLGSDDGLAVGHSMTVYSRDARYLGQIRLTHVEADRAVGIVTAKAKNIVIQKEDYVTTKL
jgi:hypothetical protein